MQIALSTDMNYLKPTLVSIMSVLEHASRNARVFVLGHNLSSQALAVLKRIETVHWNAEIVHIPITDDMLPAKFSGWGACPHITSSCMSILLVPKLVGQGRTLYLDCDTMAFGDVAELFDISLEGNLVAAVRNRNAPGSIDAAQLNDIMGGRSEAEYFNSGVVMFDCDAIVREGLDEEMARFDQVPPEYEFPDQNRLNKIFAGRTKLVSYRWNMYLRFYADGREFDSMQRLTGLDPVIRHYISPWKPWTPLEMKFFQEQRLIEVYGQAVIEYRMKANMLLSRLFGKQADVMLDYRFV